MFEKQFFVYRNFKVNSKINIFSHNLQNILKYAKWIKYSLTHEIFSNMQNKFFSTKSDLDESSTFLLS